MDIPIMEELDFAKTYFHMMTFLPLMGKRVVLV
jgi:hypothetical protein